jgi:hypothetical protein
MKQMKSYYYSKKYYYSTTTRSTVPRSWRETLCDQIIHLCNIHLARCRCSLLRSRSWVRIEYYCPFSPIHFLKAAHNASQLNCCKNCVCQQQNPEYTTKSQYYVVTELAMTTMNTIANQADPGSSSNMSFGGNASKARAMNKRNVLGSRSPNIIRVLKKSSKVRSKGLGVLETRAGYRCLAEILVQPTHIFRSLLAQHSRIFIYTITL